MRPAYRRAEVLRAISTLNLTGAPATAGNIIGQLSEPRPCVGVVHRILRQLERERRIERVLRAVDGVHWRRTP